MPDDTPTTPTTPPPPTTPFQGPGDQGVSPFDPTAGAISTLLNIIKAGGFSKFWAQFWASRADAVHTSIAWAASLVDKMFVLMGEFIKEAQGEKNPEFWELVGVIIEDLTGVEVDKEKLKTAFYGSGRLAAMDEVGKSIFNLLAEEFLTPASEVTPGLKPRNLASGIGALPAKPLSPEQGVEAARRFLGFAMSMAIRAGNVAVLGELAGLTQIENFREYGEGLARNLGLGRLMRLALKPLIDVTVAQPLEWALNLQYRPKLLGVGDLRKMIDLGLVSELDAKEELARQGYSPLKITALLQLAQKTVGDADLERLVRFEKITLNDELDELRTAGYDVRRAGFIQIGNELQRADGRINSFLSFLRSRLADGIIDLPTFSDTLNSLPLGELEKKWERVTAEVEIALPRKNLSLGQMREAFIHGTIDVSELEDFLIRVGYGANDRQILIIEALLDLKDEKQRLKLKREREATREAAREAAAQKAAQQP
jgi:hypothetical protein